MPYAPETDLSVPYAETTEADRVYRDREAMRALRECRLPDGSPLQVRPGADVWEHDCPCGYPEGGMCPWGREFNDETEECCCPDGWVVWRVSTNCDDRGRETWGPIALDPADAILLAAQKVEAKPDDR